MSEKGRYTDRAQRRLYPLGTWNSACARPMSAALAALRMTPNQVSLASLLVSLGGFVLVGTGAWRGLALGAVLVHVGLLLDHADGQVARRRGMGSTWGMYLDMVIDRIVEVGLVVSIAAAAVAGRGPLPQPLPPAWEPLGTGTLLVVATATVGVMMLWRFLTAYNDVLFLRSHLMETGAMPAEDARPKGIAKRPLIPWVFSRDWVLALWAAGMVVGQIQGTLLLLLLLHVLVTIEKIAVFRFRHKTPEGDARRILGRDYH